MVRASVNLQTLEMKSVQAIASLIVFILCSFLCHVEAANFSCSYKDYTEPTGYSCLLFAVDLGINNTLTIDGDHLEEKTDLDLLNVHFFEVGMPTLPNEIVEKFPNLKHWKADDSNIAEISPLSNV